VPNSTLVFCQDCFDRTHDPELSVNEVNTNGGCGKCGSKAVMSADALEKFNASQTQNKPHAAGAHVKPRLFPTHNLYRVRCGSFSTTVHASDTADAWKTANEPTNTWQLFDGPVYFTPTNDCSIEEVQQAPYLSETT
jgi:hypothetical protein